MNELRGPLTGPATEMTTIAVTPAGRLGLIDRTAMRLGLALILWGQRPRRTRARASLSPDELALLRRAAEECDRERHLTGRGLPRIL